MSKVISGFSKLSKQEKIDWLAENYFKNEEAVVKTIQQYWNSNEQLQQLT